MTPEASDRTNLLAVNLSLAANVLLAVVKTVVGIVGHSTALLADGINSTSDVAYLVIVRAFMRLAGKPPDREHPYGHRQLESISAVVVGAFVMTTGVAIFFGAINHAYNLLTGPSEGVPAAAVTLWVALFTVILKVWLMIFTGRVARRTRSIAVMALAHDHRNDIFSITTAALGILFSRAGYSWVDPAAGALVSLVVLYTGVEIIRDSSAELMNILPDHTVNLRIRQLVEAVQGVRRVEDVHVHRIGMYLLVDVTICIDGSLTVSAGDEIANRAERALWENIKYLRRVTVHYHPG